MFKKIKLAVTSETFFEYLFIFWFISLPFGASILAISTGSFTLYPNLFLTLFISAYSFTTLKKWTKIEWLIITFLFVWLLFSVIQPKHPYANFDIRSLMMQLLFFCVFLNSKYILSISKILEILKTGFKSYFLVLLIFGVFEFFSGIHFDGHWVEKFADLQVNNIFYAPIFIYDNSNDYLCYLIFLFLLNIIFDKELQNNIYHKLFYLVVIFIFAQYADSKFAKIIIVSIIVFELIVYIKQKLIFNRNTKTIIFTILLLVPLYFSLNKFYGPMFTDGCKYKLNEIKFVKKNQNQFEVYLINQQASEKEKQIMLKEIDSLENASSSINTRKNLIYNGLNFIKEEPILGIGPGNFVKRHIDGDIKYETDTVTNPHNFFIEIISQFGIFAWGYFTLLLVLFIRFFKSKETKLSKKYGLILICVLPILWMMPSSYLYLDINWLLLPLIYFQFNAAN